MKFAGVLLATLGSAFVQLNEYINVSTQLNAYVLPLKVLFLDFDKTLTVASYGDAMEGLCDPNCEAYTPPVACTCNMTTNYFGDWLKNNASANVTVVGEPGLGFNGTDRVTRISQTLTLVASLGIEIRIVSTSWYDINNASWAYFLSNVFQIAGLSTWLPLANILTLDDPGLNIPAHKGTVIQNYLNSKGWAPQNGLFCDDSASNIADAMGKTDWLQVANRTGLSENQLQWIEQRANQSALLVCPSASGWAPMCTDSELSTLCGATCNTAATAYQTSLMKILSYPNLVTWCISQAANGTAWSSTTVTAVTTRALGGQNLCLGLVKASASTAVPLVAVLLAGLALA